MLLRPGPATDLIVEEVDGQLCLMRLATNDVLVLNQTASDIFLLATDVPSTDDLISRLARSYGMRQEEIATDVMAVIEDLESRGILIDKPT